ncbi:hypothetical protein NN561_020301 [Cricetulus griseus]
MLPVASDPGVTGSMPGVRAEAGSRSGRPGAGPAPRSWLGCVWLPSELSLVSGFRRTEEGFPAGDEKSGEEGREGT